MARTSKTYRLFARSTPIFNAWSRNAGLAKGHEELDQAEQKEKYNGSGKAPASEATSPGINTSSTGQTTRMTVEELPLAEGESVQSAVVQCYGKPTTTKGFSFGVTGSKLGEKIASAAGALKLEWRELAVSAAELLTTLRQEWKEGLLELVATTVGGKATLNDIWSLYIEVKTLTETAQFSKNATGGTGAAPEGGGTITLSVGAITPDEVGQTLLIALQVSGAAGATSFAAAEGTGAWTLDGETQSAGATVQIWRAEVTSILKSVVPIATFPVGASLAKVAWSYASFGGMSPTAGVDTKGSATGSGTAPEATTAAATRATQGDLLIGVFGTTGNATLTAGEGMTALSGANAAGGSVAWEYSAQPAEGSKGTPKGTLSASGTWAALAVAYKVLANTRKEKEEFFATLSSTGATPRNTLHGLSAVLSFAGSLPRTIGRKKIGATLSFQGALPRVTTFALTAELIFGKALGRLISHSVAGGLTFAGTLRRNALLNLMAALSFTGNLGRSSMKTLMAALSFTGSTQRQIDHGLQGSLKPEGLLGRQIDQVIQATLTFTGHLSTEARKTLTASISFLGSLPRNSLRGLSAGLSSAGSLRRNVTKKLTAALEFLGKARSNETIQKLIAALSFTGQRGSNTVKSLTGSLSFKGEVLKALQRSLGASLSSVGSLSRSVQKKVSASLPSAGNLPLGFFRVVINASLATTGALSKNARRGVQAVLGFTGKLTPRKIGELIVERIEAALGLSGEVSPRRSTIIQRLVAALGLTGLLKPRKEPIPGPFGGPVLMRFIPEPDQLTYLMVLPTVTFESRPVNPDGLLRSEPAPFITEISPSNYEEVLHSPTATVHPESGLTETVAKTNLPDHVGTLSRVRNRTALITYDENHRPVEVSESYDGEG